MSRGLIQNVVCFSMFVFWLSLGFRVGLGCVSGWSGVGFRVCLRCFGGWFEVCLGQGKGWLVLVLGAKRVGVGLVLVEGWFSAG